MRQQTNVLRTQNTATTTGVCISHPKHTSTNTHTYTHTHAYIYIYVCFLKLLLEFLRNFPSPLSEVARSTFPMSHYELHNVLFQTTVLNIHIIILRQTDRTYSHTYFLYGLIETELFSSQCLRQTETMTGFGSLLVYQTKDWPSKHADLRVVFVQICSRVQTTACFNYDVATARKLCKLQ